MAGKKPASTKGKKNPSTTSGLSSVPVSSETEIDEEEFTGTELNLVKNKNGENYFKLLPVDVLKYTFTFLPPNALGNLQQTNKAFRKLGGDFLKDRFAKKSFGMNLQASLLEALDALVIRRKITKNNMTQKLYEMIDNIRKLVEGLDPEKNVLSLMVLTRVVLKMEIQSKGKDQLNTHLIAAMKRHGIQIMSKMKYDETGIRRSLKHTIISAAFNAMEKEGVKDKKKEEILAMGRGALDCFKNLEASIRHALNNPHESYTVMIKAILDDLSFENLFSAKTGLKSDINKLHDYTHPEDNTVYVAPF